MADDGGPFPFPGEYDPEIFGEGEGEVGVAYVPDQYIVVLEESVRRPGEFGRAQARRRGGRVGAVYNHVLNGYSAKMPKQAVEALRKDPRVRYVVRDRVVETASQTTPTGVERVFGPTNPRLDIDEEDDVRIDADVAVIDTGIDYDHPDLNVAGGTDCVPESEDTDDESEGCGGEGEDLNGHGTHVAGIAGALDNGTGTVGVAPGARLWAVRVLNKQGSGNFSWIIDGIDWVTATREDEDPENDIDVANVSIGCGGLPCEYAPLDQAFTESAEAGVVYAVAAGNQAGDAGESTFGTSPHVITVSALADYDGKPGGKAAHTCKKAIPDDTLAAFSNYGEAVEVAAPGACVYSTWKNAGYATQSGTSMASPHVAGAAALLASEDQPEDLEDVEAIREAIVEDGNSEWTDTSGDETQEPLLDIGRIVTAPPTIDSETEVTLRGRVKPQGQETSYRFEYGTSTEYGTSVPIPDAEIGSGDSYVEVSQPVEGLEGQTTYHVRVVGVNEEETFYGEDVAFGTTAPAATTEPASEIGGNRATLNAAVNPEGLATGYYFEYGPTASYGRRAPMELPKDAGAGAEAVEASVGVGVLADEQTYHYRVVAENVAGKVYGEDETFTTTAAQWTGERVEQPNPNPNPSEEVGENARSFLADVSCVAADDCMVVGNYTHYIELGESQHWDGESWSADQVPAPEEAIASVNTSISCVAETWCVAAGATILPQEEGEPLPRGLIQHWDGENWTVADIPYPEDQYSGTGAALAPTGIEGVSCASKTRCMAVGLYWTSASQFIPLVYVWDGEEWSLSTMDEPKNLGFAFRANGVDCPSDSWCIAVGETHTEGAIAAPVAEVWDGEKWTVVQEVIPGGSRPSLRDVSCVAVDHCAAVMRSKVSAWPSPHIEVWDGSEWSEEVLPTLDGSIDPPQLAVGAAELTGISCPSTDACTTVGWAYVSPSQVVPVAYAWDGNEWSVQSTAIPRGEGESQPIAYLLGVSCVSTIDCAAVGGDIPSDYERSGIAEFFHVEGNKPEAATEPAYVTGPESAMLNGAVDPNNLSTTYQFEYGTSSEYGSKVPASPKSAGSGDEVVEVSEGIEGLKPDTTYRFRVVASNSEGTAYGEEETFTTQPVLDAALSAGAGTTQIAALAEGDQELSLPYKEVTCEALEGSAPYTQPSGELQAEGIALAECSTLVFGFLELPTTVQTEEGCQFDFDAGLWISESEQAQGSVQICELTISQYTDESLETLYCQEHVPAQTVGSLTYANAELNEVATVEVEAAGGVQATVEDLDKTGCNQEEEVEATYAGSFWAYGVNGAEEQTATSVIREEPAALSAALSAASGTTRIDALAKGDLELALPEKEVTCEALEGSAPYTQPSGELQAEGIALAECSTLVFGFLELPTTVQTEEGCQFDFDAGLWISESEQAQGSVQICELTISVYEDETYETLYCQAHVPAQTVGGLTYANAELNEVATVEVEAAGGVQATVEDFNNAGCNQEEEVEAAYSGSFWAYGSNGAEEQTATSVIKEEPAALSAASGTTQIAALAEGDQEFSLSDQEVTCEALEGSAPYTQPSAELQASGIALTECSSLVFGFLEYPATVDAEEGCQFDFDAGLWIEESEAAQGSVQICELTISVYEDETYETLYCQAHVPAQTVGGLTYANAELNEVATVEVEAAGGVQATVEDFNNAGCNQEEEVEAAYSGSFWAYGSNGAEEQTATSVDATG